METTGTDKLKALSINIKTNRVYVFLNSTGYNKHYPLYSDVLGYYVNLGKHRERFTTESDIKKITDYLTN